MKIFLCGDVMTGRGIDQALPHPSSPILHEGYVQSAVDYLRRASCPGYPVLTRSRVIFDKSASPTAKTPQPLHRVSPMPHLVERMHAPFPVEQKLSLSPLFPLLLSNPPVLLPDPG